MNEEMHERAGSVSGRKKELERERKKKEGNRGKSRNYATKIFVGMKMRPERRPIVEKRMKKYYRYENITGMKILQA